MEIRKTLSKQRNSSFELIRILAQFFIVFYHIFFFFIYPNTNENFHKAIWLPLHIGVLLFILISGYFGIKASVKGFVKIIGMMIVLYVPLGLANYLIWGGGKWNLVSFVLIVSASPFWFMRTYIYLYLLSPLINSYLKNATLLQRIYLVVVLGFISNCGGTIQMDPALIEGKNVITFLFLYSIGDTLRLYKSYWNKINCNWYGLAYFIYNSILVIIYSTFKSNILDFFYDRLFFAYCSWGLLISSILFFLWIGSLNFKSRFINYIAKSSLAIYMLHCANLIFFHIIQSLSLQILDWSNNDLQLFIGIFVLTSIIVSACICVDKFLTPVWILIGKIGDYLQSKVDLKFKCKATN